MLRIVDGVRLAPQDRAPLNLRVGDLYDVFLARFVDVTHGLLRNGLARSYREVEENGRTFRGRLLFGRHVCANHARQERVYVAYEVHDADNLPNRILLRALERVVRTTASVELLHHAESALAAFPDVMSTPIRDADWSTLRFDRRTARYREALVLARMILRDERPDLRWGDRDVISLLFDMNSLFEAYVENTLRAVPGLRVRSQHQQRFWRPNGRETSSWVKPDLLVYVDGAAAPPIVVDAKWKVPPRGHPSDADLRQVFAYLHAFDARDGLLVYPRASPEQANVSGTFLTGGRTGSLVFAELFGADGPDVGGVRQALLAALNARGGT